jgi:hypothetical protein
MGNEEPKYLSDCSDNFNTWISDRPTLPDSLVMTPHVSSALITYIKGTLETSPSALGSDFISMVAVTLMWIQSGLESLHVHLGG